jgi:hypothetical protein
MAPLRKLYAWAVPIIVTGSPWDHTWVTSYDNRVHPYPDIAAVMRAKQDYWYCWGGFHAQGRTPSLPDGSLGSQNGDIKLARCLAAPNADCSASFAARGTIFTYGVDGVCHQLANQVLYATGLGGTRPLTVSMAGGYWVSSGIYGAYGLQHSAWRNKIATCTAAAALPLSGAHGATRSRQSSGLGPTMKVVAPPNPPDEFEEHVGKILGADKLPLASQLLALRAQFQTAAAAHAHSAIAPTAAELNARNQRFLDEAAKLLGDADYVAIFGVKPGTKVNLVLPDPSK